MNIIVDTCVWSYALRRHNDNHNSDIINQLNSIIQNRQVVMLGVIRQEILSGIQSEIQFERIRTKLRAFPDYTLCQNDFETAAQFYNRCRAKGIQGSNTDYLICATAHNYDFTILTFDNDFSHFKKHLNFELNLLKCE